VTQEDVKNMQNKISSLENKIVELEKSQKLLHFSAPSYSIPAPSYCIFRRELYKSAKISRFDRRRAGNFCYSILPRSYLFVALLPKIVINIFDRRAI
jgi:hypothetical protein